VHQLTWIALACGFPALTWKLRLTGYLQPKQAAPASNSGSI
jgi:hypothetical protein